MSAVYTAVTVRTNVLAEHSSTSGNFGKTARDLIASVGAQDTRDIYVFDEDYHFSFVTENGITYVCISDKDFGKRRPFNLLSAIQTEFLKRFSVDEAKAAASLSLNSKFKDTLARLTAAANSGEGDKLTQVRKAVADTTDAMHDNVRKLIDREGRLGEMVDRTSELAGEAMRFNQNAVKIRRIMWCRNIKLTLMIVGILAVVVVLGLLVIFGFPSFGSSSGSHHDDHNKGHATSLPHTKTPAPKLSFISTD